MEQLLPQRGFSGQRVESTAKCGGFDPLDAAAGSPSQAQCCTQQITARARRACSVPKGKHPIFMGCFPFGIRQCPTLPGVRQPPSSIRGTRIVATSPLLAIPDVPPACFRHWRRQAPVPLDAAMASPSQVQCCTLAGHGTGKRRCRWKTKNDPAKAESFFVWNPAVSYSPGPSPAKYHRR